MIIGIKEIKLSLSLREFNLIRAAIYMAIYQSTSPSEAIQHKLSCFNCETIRKEITELYENSLEEIRV